MNYYYYYHERIDSEDDHDIEEVIGPFSSKEEAERWYEKLPSHTVGQNFADQWPSFRLIPDDLISPEEFLSREQDEEWHDGNYPKTSEGIIMGWKEEEEYLKTPEGKKWQEERETKEKAEREEALRERKKFLESPEGKEWQEEQKTQREAQRMAGKVREISMIRKLK